MNDTKATKKQMPKGGRKGGTQFPQISLGDAEAYAKKLVAKTHICAQPDSVILPGVFDSATSPGKIRASALKQYGLMEGEAAAYQATKLAKDISAAPAGDRVPLLRAAFMNVKMFKGLYDTFHGDVVSIARLRQQASNLNVHPDNLDNIVQLFIKSAVYCALGTLEGDNISLTGVVKAEEKTTDDADLDNEETTDTEEKVLEDETDEDNQGDSERRKTTPRAVINLNVTLDSSLDTEKLEKQLKLLRRYGAI